MLGWHHTGRIHHNITTQTIIKISAVQSHHILLAPVYIHGISIVVGPVVMGMIQHLVNLVKPRIEFERRFQVVEVAQQLQGIDSAEAELVGCHDIVKLCLNVRVYHLLKMRL